MSFLRMEFFLWIVALGVTVLDTSAQPSAGIRLMKNLFGESYSTALIPACRNYSKIVTVALDLALHQVVDMDEPMQLMTLDLWTRLEWTDCRLTWDESQYDGLDHIIIPFDKVWIPDITFYDSVQKESRSTDLFKVDVYSSGLVKFHYPSLTESKCEMNVKYFPFDKQLCTLEFGSWMHDVNSMIVIKKKHDADTAVMQRNIEWRVVNFSAENRVENYSCCDAPYASVLYKLRLERKPDYYVCHILVPCILISIIGVLGFILPVESGEKVELGITVLLSLMVFLLVIEEKLPPSSDTLPMIAIYFQFAMFLVCFECIVSVIVVNLHHKQCKNQVNNEETQGISCPKLIGIKSPMTSKKYNLTEKGENKSCNGKAVPVHETENPPRSKKLAAIIDRVGIVFYSVSFLIGTSVFLVLFCS